MKNFVVSIGMWVTCLLSVACGSGGAEPPKPDPGDDGGGIVGGDAGPSGCLVEGCAEGEGCDSTTGQCRELLTCDDFSCKPRQKCGAEEGSDAECLEECDDGYDWDSLSRNCLPKKSCQTGDPGSIAEQCAAANRKCEDLDDVAQCTDCVEGAVATPGACVVESCDVARCTSSQVCVEDPDTGRVGCECREDHVMNDDGRCLPTCAALDCEAQGKVCIEGSEELGVGGDCVLPQTCDEGYAVQERSGTSNCVECDHCYSFDKDGVASPRRGVTGTTGQFLNEDCVCTLEEGLFQDFDGFVRECDEDGDGWVSSASTTLGDDALRLQARCDVKAIASFTLTSDDPVATSEVPASHKVSVAEVVDRYEIGSTHWEMREVGDEQVMVFPMLEDYRLDQADEFGFRYAIPGRVGELEFYGQKNVSLPHRPAQANPLTKVCNFEDDDFNFDYLSDATQAQEGAVDDRAVSAWAPRLAYFMELASGEFRDPDGNGVGEYLITEKSRNGGFVLPLATPYERSCMRGRDVEYRPGLDNAETGFDFAQFHQGCDKDEGACTVDGRIPYDGREPRFFGGLETLTSKKWNPQGPKQWPGLNHHSQFKCVPNTASVPPTRTGYACEVEGSGEPDFACAKQQGKFAANRYSHWESVDYRPGSGAYERGCIDEQREWSGICADWNASYLEQRFSTVGLATGEFTCAADCERNGTFVTSGQGAICCYGSSGPGQECDQSDFDLMSSDEPVLACALEPKAVTPNTFVKETCDQALGVFQWADANDTKHDPNRLVWAANNGGAFNDSGWESGN